MNGEKVFLYVLGFMILFLFGAAIVKICVKWFGS